MTDYIPTAEMIRETEMMRDLHRMGHHPNTAPGRNRDADFDRWLAARDAEVAATAKASVFAETQWPRWVDESRTFSKPAGD